MRYYGIHLCAILREILSTLVKSLRISNVAIASPVTLRWQIPRQHEITPMWIAQDITGDKSTLVRLWLGAVRQQAISWTNIVWGRCRHMASLGHNELKSYSKIPDNYQLTWVLAWISLKNTDLKYLVIWSSVFFTNDNHSGIYVFCVIPGHTSQIIVISLSMSHDCIPFMCLCHSCNGCTGGAKRVDMPATVYLTTRPFCVCRLTLRPRQNGRHFADDNFKCNILIENVCISNQIFIEVCSQGSY